MPDQPSGSEGSQESQQQSAITDATPFDVQMVPEPMRNEAHWTSFKGKTVGEVLKSGLEAHKTVGGSVRIPGEKAEQTEWTSFYSKMRPAEAKGYNLKINDDVKEVLTPERATQITQLLWDAGLHPRQADAIMQGYQSMLAGEAKTIKQQIETGVVENTRRIKDKYKEGFDEASIKANRVAKRFGGDGFVQLVKDYNLSADPTFFDTFVSIANALHEDSWVSGNTTKFLSRGDADRKISEILNDRVHPYHHLNHPSHAAAVEEMDNLRKVKYAPKDE